MSKNRALRLAAGVFFVGALAQASRVALRFRVVFGETEMPIWVNGIACVVLLSLAIYMYRAARA